MHRKKKCRNETFEETVNRVRATYYLDLKRGDTKDVKHNFCPWEWDIYDWLIQQTELKQKLLRIKQKIQMQLEEGDDF